MASAAFERGIPDALALRRAIYNEGDASRNDLENLIARGPAAGSDPGFRDLVAEVARDVFLHQVDPEGYVSDADAAWLISRLSEGGGLSCPAEFAILSSVLSHAIETPVSLSEFAVREIEKAILTGRRDALGGTDHEAGVVTAADVEALRLVAFAPTRGSSLHVNKATAEALFDIAHATAAAANAPEFADFFAKAVGNYLMGVAFIGTPDRAEVLAHEAELARPTGFGAFFAALTRGPTSSEIADALESTEGEEEDADFQRNVETESRLTAAERIDAGEAQWILAHLSRGDVLTNAEKRLLAFLRDEASSAPPEIIALYDKAA